ncbi:hypothetical protein NRF20_45265 [Streptomyces sp. R-74717]|uniref:hypothetical protein n=1 Tax=Streptomyces TaxID=1883 RepID=UPI0037ACA05D
MPADINHQVLRALHRHGPGLEKKDVGGYKAEALSELWLRDVETTAWRVLYATRKRDTWEEQQEFRNGWKLS